MFTSQNTFFVNRKALTQLVQKGGLKIRREYVASDGTCGGVVCECVTVCVCACDGVCVCVAVCVCACVWRCVGALVYPTACATVSVANSACA